MDGSEDELAEVQGHCAKLIFPSEVVEVRTYAVEYEVIPSTRPRYKETHIKTVAVLSERNVIMDFVRSYLSQPMSDTSFGSSNSTYAAGTLMNKMQTGND